ncbi:MAG: PAS domain S-box protein [bacterium]|nr:PAS domain S-box protein [bacterium]
MNGLSQTTDLDETPRSQRLLTRCALLAVAYFVTGKLAFELALPPASASPIWPAAGVALAGVLYWGPRVWPGLLIGAVLVQVTERPAVLDAGLLSMPGLALVGTSVGPILQAFVGRALIRRAHEFPVRIRRARDIVRRVVLGGPVACVVAATFGTASLLGPGDINSDQVVSTWFTWWFGNSLGVLVVLPLAFAWRSGLRTLRPRAHAAVSLVIAAASLLSIFGYVVVRDGEWDASEATFDRNAVKMRDLLTGVVATKAEVLHGVANFYGVDEQLSRDRFKRFVERDFIRHEDIAALGWVPVVKPEHREEFEALAGTQHDDPTFRITEQGPDGAVVSAGTSGLHWHAVVQFIHPEQGNKEAIGFDLASEPTRRKALEHARDTGELTATGPITLVQDEDPRPAILLVAHCNSASAPRAAPEGPDAFVSGVFRTERMIEPVLAPYRQQGLAFCVMDVTAPERPGLLCPDPQTAQPPRESEGHLATTVTMPVAGRQWALQVWALPTYLDRPVWWGALATLAGGLLCTALLASLLIIMTGSAARTERSNEELRQEVRERRSAEAALQKSKRRFQDIVQSTAEWVWEINTEGEHVFTNNGLVAILGYAEGDLIQSRTFDRLHPDDRRELRAKLAEHVEEKTGWTGWVLRWQHKDGTHRYLESNAQAVLDPNGKLIGFRGADRDITERRLLQERWLQTQKMESLGVLAGGIAHDFNNLLTAIGGNLDYALKGPGGPNEEALEDAQRALERATGLTGQLLTFSKGGAPIVRSVDLRDLIQEWSRFALRGAQTRCEVHTPDDLWPARVDANQISQVIGNLIINADQAMPGGGLIEVSARNTHGDPMDRVVVGEGRFVEISVRDHGPGIPPEVRSRIFDPYFTTKEDGTGLGLATVYSIVKRHGGHVLVDSEPRQGSTFHVYLPAAERADELVEQAPAHVGASAGGRALVMDDAPFVRAFVARALDLLGFQVELAAAGEEAVEMFAEAHGTGRPFDIVILDLTVPGGMGGAAALAGLRTIDPHVCAIASSGYSASPVMAKPDEHGFAGVIAKPYTIAQLDEVLSAALAKKHIGSKRDGDCIT